MFCRDIQIVNCFISALGSAHRQSIDAKANRFIDPKQFFAEVLVPSRALDRQLLSCGLAKVSAHTRNVRFLC
jgi:hypothetical protein